MADLEKRLFVLQYVLAKLGRLECPLCQEPVSENEALKRCKDTSHFCHASCIVEERCGQCPTCGSDWSEEVASFEERAGDQDRQFSGEAEMPVLTASDEGAVLELQERLDALTETLSQPEPPEAASDLADIAAALEECEVAAVTLQSRTGAASEYADGAVHELVLQLSEIFERLSELRLVYQAWTREVERPALEDMGTTSAPPAPSDHVERTPLLRRSLTTADSPTESRSTGLKALGRSYSARLERSAPATASAASASAPRGYSSAWLREKASAAKDKASSLKSSMLRQAGR